MVELLEGKVLSKYLLEKYSKKPNGWSFTVFPSAKEDNGFFGALVGGPDEVWQLKLDSIFKPNPMILGAKVDMDPTKVANHGLFPYGYRKLDQRTIVELLQALADSDDGSTTLHRDRYLIDQILGKMKPVAPETGGSYAEGPFVITNRENLGITSSQKQLEDKLSLELRKLLRNRYSSYG